MSNGKVNGEAKFTPTQQRILAVLVDGLPHRRKELLASLQDELATYHLLSCHLHLLRKRLRKMGETIICELSNQTICYRHVKFLNHRSVQGIET